MIPPNAEQKPDQNQSPSSFSFTSKLKPLILCTLSTLILLIAISFSFITKTTKPTFFQSNLGFFHQTQKPNPISKPPPYCVLWTVPFLSGGGYSSESWSYILALNEHVKTPRFKLAIEHHGDLQSLQFWEGLPHHMRNLAVELYNTECRTNETIVICHSEPGNWYPPLFDTLPCSPTPGYGDFMAVVGRTKFETDRVSPEYVKRCNRTDFVWVLTDFHVSTFIRSGVDPAKVVKIVQPVDVGSLLLKLGFFRY
ncbi:hypothetical protein AB3S75_034688 [Citrus x aurantiifolia]